MRGFGRLFCAGLVSCAGLALSPAALAEDNPNGSNFSPTAKGVVGGALLGAEAVMLVEAAADVKPAWAYAVGGGLGAVGGAVGGIFAEKSSGELSMYLLVGGMALAIPTTVAVLSATAFEPVNYVEDRPAPDEPVADPAQPTPAPTTPATSPSGKRQVEPRGDRVASKKRKPLAIPPALVGVGEGTLTLSVPAVEVRHVYTRTEIATLGVKQATEVAVPVLNVVF